MLLNARYHAITLESLLSQSRRAQSLILPSRVLRDPQQQHAYTDEPFYPHSANEHTILSVVSDRLIFTSVWDRPTASMLWYIAYLTT